MFGPNERYSGFCRNSERVRNLPFNLSVIEFSALTCQIWLSVGCIIMEKSFLASEVRGTRNRCPEEVCMMVGMQGSWGNLDFSKSHA
jgi:hypothetical protein